jgi:hypothetical protein
MIGGNNFLFTDPDFDDTQPPRGEIIFFSPTLTSAKLSKRGGKLFLGFIVEFFILWLQQAQPPN